MGALGEDWGQCLSEPEKGGLGAVGLLGSWGGLVSWSPCRRAGSREQGGGVPGTPSTSEGPMPHSPALGRSPGTSSSSSGSITDRHRGREPFG